MYRCTTTKAAFGTPESVLQPESRASPAEGEHDYRAFPSLSSRSKYHRKKCDWNPVAQQEKRGAPHVLGCTPKWSIRGSWNGTHDSPPQRRQAATRWQTNTTVCILCVGGSPKLGPATTLAGPSVGRGPRIGRIRHRTHPQRRQNSKICTADDGKPSTASSEIQNLSQHRRLPPPASPESQVSAQQRRLRSPHIRNRTSDHRI